MTLDPRKRATPESKRSAVELLNALRAADVVPAPAAAARPPKELR